MTVAEPAERQEAPSTVDGLRCCYTGAKPDEVCRECGCTPDNACIRHGEVCGWAEPGLCTACTPDAAFGWKHPSRESGCRNQAEFEITDCADKAFPDGRGVTHACTEHVGDLLGHATDGNYDAGDDECWEVRPI